MKNVKRSYSNRFLTKLHCKPSAKRNKKLSINTLLVLGCFVCLHASWLPAKAWLSQEMILYSWQQSIKSSKAVKPWPWADTFPLAELTLKRLNKNIIVLNGGDPTTLAFSAGAVAPFNQINQLSPFVIAGHKDSHFSFLDEVNMSDIISLADKHGQSQLYQVEAIDIIDASTGQLPLLADEANLILITCYPFDSLESNPNERFVITARKI